MGRAWLSVIGWGGVLLWGASTVNTILAEVYDTAPTTLVWFESVSFAAAIMALIIRMLYDWYDDARPIATVMILTAIAGLAFVIAEIVLLFRALDCDDLGDTPADECTTDDCSIRRLGCFDEGYTQRIVQLVIAFFWAAANIALVFAGFSYRTEADNAEKRAERLKNAKTSTSMDSNVPRFNAINDMRSNRSWLAVSKV